MRPCFLGEPSTFTGHHYVDASSQVREVRRLRSRRGLASPSFHCTVVYASAETMRSLSWGLVISELGLSLAPLVHRQPLPVIVLFGPQSKLVS
jgi:hypothetical protein